MEAKFSIRWLLILLLGILLIGSVVVYVVAERITSSAREKQEIQLKNVNRRASIEFADALDRFVYIVSGLRTHLKYSQPFPTQEELFKFVNHQLNELNYTDSLIISYLDTNHVFKYSFTREKINPTGLVGKSVADFRSEKTIVKLNEVLEDEAFHLFAATNLVEGWVGIPLHFNIVREEKSVGYIAAIINFKAIIDPIYELESPDIFAYRFSVDAREFDRERAYDGSRVHHERSDPNYFRNYEIDDANYVFTTFQRHGLIFKIGTAYIDNEIDVGNLKLFLYGWFVLMTIFAVYSLVRIVKFNRLNKALQESIDTIEFQKTKLDIQNDELNKLNSTKDKFFSIIGHDLRSPLLSISSVVDLWNSKSLNEKQSEELMEKLGGASRSASRLLENLLQWAMVNTGQIRWNPEKIVLDELVQEVFFQLAASASSKKIQLKKSISVDCTLLGDRNMLATSIRNLVSNAIKFSTTNSTVNVFGKKEDESILVEVSDQGKGLTDEEITSLFMLTDSSKSKAKSGTGLGLILVKEFVERHDARISVSSEKDRGTTFQITFPASSSKGD